MAFTPSRAIGLLEANRPDNCSIIGGEACVRDAGEFVFIERPFSPPRLGLARRGTVANRTGRAANSCRNAAYAGGKAQKLYLLLAVFAGAVDVLQILAGDLEAADHADQPPPLQVVDHRQRDQIVFHE